MCFCFLLGRHLCSSASHRGGCCGWKGLFRCSSHSCAFRCFLWLSMFILVVGGVFIFGFFVVSFLDLFWFFVASGFCGFWLLWLLASVASGFCGFWLSWLSWLLWLLAFVAFGFLACPSICLYLSIYLSIFLSFFWQLFSFLFLYLLFLLFSLQRRNQTRKQASKHELLTFGSGVLLGGAPRPPPNPPRATKSALHPRHPRLPRNQYFKVNSPVQNFLTKQICLLYLSILSYLI